jgi:hypothetical protein
VVMLLEDKIRVMGEGERDNAYPLRRRGTAIAALVISIRLRDLEELWHMSVSVTLSRYGN